MSILSFELGASNFASRRDSSNHVAPSKYKAQSTKHHVVITHHSSLYSSFRYLDLVPILVNSDINHLGLGDPHPLAAGADALGLNDHLNRN